MARSTQHHRGPEAAFTVVETLVAVVIATIGALILAAAIRSANQRQISLQAKAAAGSDAAMLAQVVQATFTARIRQSLPGCAVGSSFGGCGAPFTAQAACGVFCKRLQGGTALETVQETMVGTVCQPMPKTLALRSRLAANNVAKVFADVGNCGVTCKAGERPVVRIRRWDNVLAKSQFHDQDYPDVNSLMQATSVAAATCYSQDTTLEGTGKVAVAFLNAAGTLGVVGNRFALDLDQNLGPNRFEVIH